jgi:hypothetical protein
VTERSTLGPSMLRSIHAICSLAMCGFNFECELIVFIGNNDQIVLSLENEPGEGFIFSV